MYGMKESKSVLAEIIDCLLLVAVLLAGLFVFMRTFFRAVDALFAAVAVTASALAFVRKRDRAFKSKIETDKRCRLTFDYLTYAGEKQRLDYFALALSRFDRFEPSDGCLKCGNRLVYPLFLPSGALPARLSDIQDRCIAENAKALVILPDKPDSASEAFIDKSDRIKALYGEKLCALLVDTPLSLPEKRKAAKGKLKRLLSSALEREMFRRYLFSGAVLLGTSYILPTSPLYIAAGALCLVLALVTLLPRRKNA